MQPQPWHQQYDDDVPPSLDYEHIPLADFLKRTAANYPERAALIFGGLMPLLGEQHRVINYHELNSLVDRLAAGLQQAGLQPGQRVALFMPNCPQMVIAYYGVLRAGGIVVPCNPLYVAPEIRHQLNDSGASMAIVLSLFYPTLKQVRQQTALKQVIVTNIKEYFPTLLKGLFTVAIEKKKGHALDISAEPDTIWFQQFLANAPATPQAVDIRAEDTAVLMYTGGTTGIAKGAELSHQNLITNATQAAVWLRGDKIEGYQTVMTALPLTHSYAVSACMNYAIFHGNTQVLIPNPRDLKHLLASIASHKPTLLPGVPTLYAAINNHPDVKRGTINIKSLKLCLSAAAALPIEVQQEFQRVTGGKLREAYGLSEASPATHAVPLRKGSNRIGTIGVPLPDTVAKIMDADTEETELGVNEPGALCVHGPQVMKGYWNMPEETELTLRRHADGKLWLHTGDIAVMREDGYFELVDRKKDLILASGGLNVYPREIEERLYEHPKVLEAVAIGVPVGGTNQRAKVYIVLRPEQTASADEIIAWCREGLAPYKVPKMVEFRDDLPKTHVGKILRRVLLEEEQARDQENAQ